MRTYKSLAAASLALVLLAACGSSGIGDILGGGGSTSGASNYEIRGTVDSVDPNSRSIYLTNVSGYTSMLSNGGSGSNVRVYYDDRTPVSHQGSTYRPEDLERGDQISVRVDEDGNRLVASTMTVISDVSTGSSNNYPTNQSGVYGSNVRGTVRYIDSSRRTIEVDTGSVQPVIVEFDTSTPVYFGNQTYRPADLERGDEIDVRLDSNSGNRYVARDITVTRNISDNGSISGTAQSSTIRGTVRNLDRSRRTIELDSASFISGFNTGAGTGTRTMIVSYDNNTRIDVNGTWESIEGVERGDVIEVQVRNTSGSTYIADRAFLLRNVRN